MPVGSSASQPIAAIVTAMAVKVAEVQPLICVNGRPARTIFDACHVLMTTIAPMTAVPTTAVPTTAVSSARDKPKTIPEPVV